MAETDNNTSSLIISLPKKEWLPLEEIADRWGCKSDDLLSLAEDGKLGICFYFNSARVNWFLVKEKNYLYSQDEIFISQGMFRLSQSSIRSLMISDEAQAEFLYFYPRVGQDHKYGHVVFDGKSKRYDADSILRKGLRVAREEVERYELENRKIISNDEIVKPVEQSTEEVGDPSYKSTKQVNAILEVIKLEGLEPLKLRTGEKKLIKKIVTEKYSTLFDRHSSFENAWRKAGRVKNLVRMEHHDSYKKRGG